MSYRALLALAALLPAPLSLAQTCPPNYVLIAPASPSLPSFCIAKYEMANAGGVAVSQPGLQPWANISRFQAVAACQALGPDYDLISNRQWQEVAHEIESTAANWSGGAVGVGSLSVGHASPTPAAPLPTSADDNNSCIGTNESCSLAQWADQRRTMFLPNGIIWDFSGNVSEWVRDNNFTISGFYASSAGDASLRGDPHLLSTFATLTDYSASPTLATMGFGQTDLRFANGSMSRGSDYTVTGLLGGIYAANGGFSPGDQVPELGFRCVEQPLTPPTPTITCPSGYVEVDPADPTLHPFCVAKYEAKNVNQVAVSQAASAPWTSINRADAITACAANGAGYDLIRNAEWQEIARQIESNPANWSSGAVGSGSIAVGTTSYNPYTTLAASPNDRQPCFGTGHVCDNTIWDQAQRTLQLKFGVVWDLNGNVSEWTKDDNHLYLGWAGYASDPALASLPLAKDRYGSSLTSTAGNYSLGLGYVNLLEGNGTIVRGGNYGNSWATAGIFTTDFSYAPDAAEPQLGFRCVYRPYGDPGPVPPPPPPAPLNLAASNITPRSFHLTWTTGAASTAGFVVALQSGSAAPACSAGASVGTSTSFDATGLTSSTAYSATVCAVDASGAFSQPATLSVTTAPPELPPPSPTRFTVTNRLSTELDFKWTSGGLNTTGFRLAIAKGTAAPPCATGKTLGLVTTDQETGLTPNTKYTASLCAVNASGALSAPVVVQTSTKN